MALIHSLTNYFVLPGLNNLFFGRKHHVAGQKRWWILQKTLCEFYQMCFCVLNLKEMCNANFAAGFALFCLPILQLLYFTSPSVVDGLALRSLRRLSILKSAPRQWSLLNKLQIELVQMAEVLSLLTMAKTE